MRKIITGAALAMTLGGGLVATAVTSASASTVLAKAVTISVEHPDTTGITCAACEQGPGGPIWANDHLKETVTATSAGTAGHYNVKISFAGSTFSGFADPGQPNSTDPGGPLFSQGTLSGSITYDDIASSTAPDASNVPATEPPATSLGTVIAQLFHKNNGPAASTHYTVNYTQSAAFAGVDPTGGTTNTWPAGTTYTQTG